MSVRIPNGRRLLLVSFRGAIGSGKTTAADILVHYHGFTRLSFAAPLKKVAEKITPDGRIDKARDRELLQFLGTEYFRALDPDYWVKQWVHAVVERLELTDGECRIIVDDCRFGNERAAVRRLFGYEFYLETRPEDRNARVAARDGAFAEGIAGHSSEAELPLEGAKVIKNLYGLDFLRASLADALANLEEII
jgi:dephospho-CoA kinase